MTPTQRADMTEILENMIEDADKVIPLMKIALKAAPEEVPMKLMLESVIILFMKTHDLAHAILTFLPDADRPDLN